MSDEEWDTSLVSYDYVALVYCYVACVIVTFIVGAFVREIYKSNTGLSGQQSSDEADNTKTITRASIAAIFLYSLSTILYSIALTKWIAIDQEHGIMLNYTLVGVVAVTPYMWNLMGVVPFILLQRLNRIVANRCIHVFSFVALIFGIIWYPLFQIVVHTVGLSNSEAIRSIATLFVMLSLIMYLVVAFMYLHQISKVMKSRIQSRIFEMDDKKESDAADASVVSVVSFQSVRDTVRCALLVMICALSNLLTPVMGSIGMRIARHITHQSTLGFFGVFTDIICNTVCILFLFRFAEKYYFYWCKPCHACTMRCCERKVVKWYGNTDSKWTEKDYESLLGEDLVTSDRNRQ